MTITHATARATVGVAATRSGVRCRIGPVIEWAPELVPAVTHPGRRTALRRHARHELGRLSLGERVVVTLHRQAYFRLPDSLPPVSEAPVVEVYAESVLLARVVNPTAVGCPIRLGVAAWADDDDRQARARFLLGTKGQTLARLSGMVTSAQTLPQLVVSAGRWRHKQAAVLDEITGLFVTAAAIIVRSSAAGEDSWHESRAGAHDSVTGVDPRDRGAVAQACRQVFSSYGHPQAGDELLIQPMLTSVVAAGVVTTREPLTKGPYYVVACDDTSGRTDTVTAGAAGTRTVYVARDSAAPAGAPAWVSPAIALARELEGLIGCDELDIEFAVTTDRVVLLQVRRLAGRAACATADAAFAVGAQEARRTMGAVAATPTLGEGVHLSGMSDWNPAEMIGFRPKPLARSLYEYLITDEVWARSRHGLGYRDLRGIALMVDVAGYAFIDVRTSMNSFVPAEVSDSTAAAVVAHYLAALDAAPHLHDKVEFDVAVTCLDFRWPRNAAALTQAGVTAAQVQELRAGLRTVTQRIMQVPAATQGYFARSAALHDSIGDAADLRSAQRRLAFVRCDGALVFADAARAGFVAMSLLRSLIDIAASTGEQIDEYMTSLHTVSGELVADGHRVADRALGWEAFVDRYGHLRPGTYDICSPTYGSRPLQFLAHFTRPYEQQRAPAAAHAVPWDVRHRPVVAAALQDLGLDTTPEDLQEFIRHAIELRERVKFDFTRHLSRALETIAAHYGQAGMTRETLSYLRIGDLWTPPAGWNNDPARLHRVAEQRRRAYEQGAHVRLPDYCTGTQPLDGFEVPAAAPTFIGQDRVHAAVTIVGDQVSVDPTGTVVAIEAADPGHDWIFGYPIVGLITRYGGTNSHMAIRAAELALPAAIGVGEKIFTAVVARPAVDLDCGARQVIPL